MTTILADFSAWMLDRGAKQSTADIYASRVGIFLRQITGPITVEALVLYSDEHRDFPPAWRKFAAFASERGVPDPPTIPDGRHAENRQPDLGLSPDLLVTIATIFDHPQPKGFPITTRRAAALTWGNVGQKATETETYVTSPYDEGVWLRFPTAALKALYAWAKPPDKDTPMFSAGPGSRESIAPALLRAALRRGRYYQSKGLTPAGGASAGAGAGADSKSTTM